MSNDERAKMIANQLRDEWVKLAAKYKRLSLSLGKPGVDAKLLKQRLEDISGKVAEIDRQLDLLGK